MVCKRRERSVLLNIEPTSVILYSLSNFHPLPALYITCLLHIRFEKWADKPVRNRGEDYLEFKDQLTRHLMDILCEFVPQVKGRIEYYQLGTPLSEETFLASWRGGR